MADDIPPFPGKPLGGGYYEISEEDLKDWTLFRPGIQHPDDPFDILPHEGVTKNTRFALLDIIIFFDWASTHPVDEGGRYQWAFVVDDYHALYIRGKVHSIALSDIHKMDSPTVIHRIPEALAKLVALFF
jgi:hypothetical protein